MAEEPAGGSATASPCTKHADAMQNGANCQECFKLHLSAYLPARNLNAYSTVLNITLTWQQQQATMLQHNAG